MFANKWRLVGVSLTSAMIIACGGGGSGGGSGSSNVTCSSFTYQQDAQAYFNSNRSSAAGLDADKDGVACESLRDRPTSSTPTFVTPVAAMMPTGVWVGSLGNGEGVRGVIFPSGDTWFLRTRSSGSTTVPTWLLHGAGAISGSTFSVVQAPTARVDPGTTPVAANTNFVVTVQQSNSLNGSWVQTGAGSFPVQAAFQPTQLPPPSLSTLAGDYGDPGNTAAGATLTIALDGTLTARLGSGCVVGGRAVLTSGDPAYRISLTASGTCPANFSPGSGVVIFDKTNNQIYLASMTGGSTAVSATLASATKR